MSGPTYPNGYPNPQDWDGEAVGLLPDVAAVPPGADYFVHLVHPLVETDDRFALLYQSMVNLDDAAGDGLDLAGDQVFERRDGLNDSEYRRIIAGRRVAVLGGGTSPRLFAGWKALTESSTATLELPGSSSVRLAARVSFVPTLSWLVRAGSVVRDMVEAGVDVSATIYRSGSAIYGATTYPYGIGDYAWSIRVPR